MAHRTGIISKDGSRVHIFPNGGPADTTRDCICCGNEPPPIVDWPGIRYMTNNPPNYGPAFGIARSDGAPSAIHTCFSGCCACTTVASSLDFHMHSCKTITVLQQPSYFPSWDGSIESECTNTDGAYPMTFTLQKRVTECYGTQFFANNPSVTQNYRNDRNIHWNAFAENFGGSNFQACTTWPPEAGSYWYLPVEDSTTEYTDEDPAIKNTDYYPEAWGFSGNVCGGTTTPSRPGYSYPGSCGGQAIVASLCCCKTGTESIERIGGYDKSYLRSCPKWSIKWPHIQPVPEAHRQEDTDDRVDGSMGCFSFTIQPDHKYKHSFKVLKQSTTDTYGDWELVDSDTIGESIYTSCSPCVYKQGECEGCYGLHGLFNPSQEYDIAMDVGTMKPLKEDNFPYIYGDPYPATNNTVWNGQHFIIGGQCNDGKDGNQKMRLIVCGAYLTHCDCQQGDYDDCNYGSRSACYGDVQHPGDQPIPCWENTAGCDECLEKHVPDVSEPYDDLGGVGMRLIYANWPCAQGFGPPGAPDYRDPPDYPCGTMAQRENDMAGLGWRQTPETNPEDWNTAGTVEQGYSRTEPFGGNEIWFYGGRDEKGTHPTLNEKIDVHYWAWLYCAEDAENDDSCGSLCEHVDPAIMWYTGIIEET